MAEATARPLFQQGRRPWVLPAPEEVEPVLESSLEPEIPAPPTEEPAPLAAIAPEITLLGIQRNPSGDRTLVAIVGAPEPVWIGIGDQVAGWTLSGIEVDAIELALGEVRQRFPLYRETPEGLP